MDRFRLVKWYLDCVDAEGRSAILYATALTWGPVRVNWHGLSIHEPGRPPVHRSSLAAVDLPERRGETIAWDAPSLGCAVVCDRALAPFFQRLLDLPDGALDWRCEAPAGSMSVTLADGRRLEGQGYAERLELTLPPWRLPIDDLRWGRWIADDGRRSVAWVDWDGPRPRTDVFLDGRRQDDAEVGGGRVRAGDVSLEVGARRAVHSRSLSSALAGLPHLLSLLPAAWRGIEDTKWLSRACLVGPGLQPQDGWCIDELVRFPR